MGHIKILHYSLKKKLNTHAKHKLDEANYILSEHAFQNDNVEIITFLFLQKLLNQHVYYQLSLFAITKNYRLDSL